MIEKSIINNIILCILLSYSCKDHCKGIDLTPRFDFPLRYSLIQDTLSIGDTIEVSLTYPVDFVSPDREDPISFKDFHLGINFQTYRVDTLINDEFVTRHDPSVDLVPIVGEVTFLSRIFEVTPMLDAAELNYSLSFYIVLNSKGIYATSWGSVFDDDELPNVDIDCYVAAQFFFPVEEGQRNHYLLEHIPDEKSREIVKRHVDRWGTISLVVQ